jgi:YbbR domain-containing protein
VRRLVRFFFRNWPLKVGAVGLAVILYSGMVILQSTAVWPGTVAITPVNFPDDSTLIETLPTVSDIRYVAPPEVPITVNSFTAKIDLAGVKPSESEKALLNVTLTAVDQRIQIIDYQPKQIRITLDPIISNIVPVVPKIGGSYPSDLQPGTPNLSVTSVTVRGAATYVRQVAYARAEARIDDSGLDVNQDVDLIACNANGDPVNNVTLNPRQTHITIAVGSNLRTQSVPVHPVIINSPASGYDVTGIEVTPPVIEVQGQADALAKLKGLANTKPISIAGATGDVTVAAIGFDLPAGVAATDVTSVQVIVHLKSQDSTRTVSIGLVPEGARAGVFYVLSASNGSVTIGGATAALNAFDTSSLTGSVAVGSLGPGTHTVQVVVTLPAGIKLVSLNPSQVTVTVTIPATPSPSPQPTPTTAAP